MVFTDYGQRPDSMMAYAGKHFEYYWHRPHPSEHPDQNFNTLAAIWPNVDVAIGHGSTVLVEAAINGLEVISFDPRHVCQDLKHTARPLWLTRLSWAMWNHNQIQKGHFWEHLNDQD